MENYNDNLEKIDLTDGTLSYSGKKPDAGYALFNEDGVLIDKIVSLYIQAFGFYTETIEDILQFITFVSRLDDDYPFDD